MSDTPNGDGYAHNFNARMDRMNDYLQSMTESFLEHHRVTMTEIKAWSEANSLAHREMMAQIKESREEHQRKHRDIMAEIDASREEIQDLITLQREQRYDVMALFMERRERREKESDK